MGAKSADKEEISMCSKLKIHRISYDGSRNTKRDLFKWKIAKLMTSLTKDLEKHLL